VIVVKIFGGLGNQMFQYAFFLYQNKYNENVYLDISDFKIHKHHYGFELKKTFQGVTVNSPNKKELSSLCVNNNFIILRIINKLFHISIVSPYEVREMPAKMFVEPFGYDKNIYYNGFWANKKYVDEVEEELRNIFRFTYVPDGENLKLLENMRDKNTVSVHIRRGDFLKNKNISDCCDISYYQKAFKYMMDRDPECVFIIFSDDIEWAKENITFSRNVEFISWNQGEDSSRDMLMMSKCKNHIIANSTFSWWGAWLNPNKEKIVIAPKKWSEREKGINPMLDEKWVLL